MKNNKVDYLLYISGDFNQADVAFPEAWNDLLIYAKVTDTQPNLRTFEGPMVSLPDRIVCSTEHIAAAQIDILIPAHRRYHLSGHYQLTATFTVRPCVKSDTKDPIHQTVPSDVFCPGCTEADPYMVPNDLQESIWRLQRLQGVMKLNLLPRYGHGGDIDQSLEASAHPWTRAPAQVS